jgi:type IX secretion system substrate protein
MKKLLLLACLFTAAASNAQVDIYNTTHAGLNGAEITPTANGLATSFGDAIQFAGTERILDVISVDLFNLTDTSPVTLTMSLYSDCPTLTGVAACGSGAGTLIPFSENEVVIDAPPTTGKFTVDFEYNSSIDLSDQIDNTITVMIRASRNNVFWVINEVPVVGSLPPGDVAPSTVSRCGSTLANNGCNRIFAAPAINNVAMRITAFPSLKTTEFSASAFNVFPNPVGNAITVSNDKNILINAISISDMNGRIVKQQSFNNVTELEMNVSELALGVYTMNISSGEGNTIKKIIKN